MKTNIVTYQEYLRAKNGNACPRNMVYQNIACKLSKVSNGHHDETFDVLSAFPSLPSFCFF